MQAEYPVVHDSSQIDLVEAYHPLLFLYNRRLNKPTVPVTLQLNEKNRILVISGPNAGGKTVTMKTIGLLQMMVQSGLLVPVHPSSENPQRATNCGDIQQSQTPPPATK